MTGRAARGRTFVLAASLAALLERPGLAFTGLALTGLALTGCADEEPEPVSVARAYVRAMQGGDTEAVLALADAQTVARVRQASERASDQVGGRRNIESQEMLQVVDVDPRLQVASMELVNNSGEQATVKLTSADGSEQTLTLVNENGAWRVTLPLPRAP